MASTYSTRLRLELIGDGEQSGTWGDTTNTNLGTLIEEAIAGVASVTHDDTANYTLTNSNGATDEARQMVLEVGGTLTANRNVVCPTQEKLYFVSNATSGGFSITLKTSGGSGITIANGDKEVVYCDGTNVVNGINNLPSGTTVAGVTISTASATETLTNKTIDADNSTITNLAHGSEVDNLTTGVHGVSGTIVGTSDTQTLTNKTIDGDNNTISNLAHGAEVDDLTTGVHGVTGTIVGTSDTQTLTNKTITSPVLTLTQSTTPTPTAEGRVEWDTDGNSLAIGDGASTQVFSSDTGTATLTNKTLTSPSISAPTITGTWTATGATCSDLGGVTTCDINGGTIDGATIGGASAGAITGTTITASTEHRGTAFDTNGASDLTIRTSGGTQAVIEHVASAARNLLFGGATASGDPYIGTSGGDLSITSAANISTGSSGGTADAAADDLTIESNGNAGLSIMTPAANNGRIAFESDSGEVSYIQSDWNSGSPQIEIATNGTVRATLLSGLQLGSPTGGDQGAGTLNATGLYINGAAVSVTSSPDFIVCEHRQTAGTNGGSSAHGSWQTVPMTDETTDTGSDNTLSSNQMTISSGSYELFARAAFSESGDVRLRWRNISDNTTDVIGLSGSPPSGSTNYWVPCIGYFTIGASKTFELQYFCTVTKASDGLGKGNGTPGQTEVYAQVYLRKVA